MNILVAKNGSQLGPFSENDVRAKLAAGEFAPADYGWYEGLTAWTPLSQLLGTTAPSPSPIVPVQPLSAQPQPYAAPHGQGTPGSNAPQPYNSPYPSPYVPGAMPGLPGASGYGGFWRRFLAYLIDGFVLAIPFVVLCFIAGLVVGMLSGGRTVDRDGGLSNGFTAVVALVEIAYFFVIWLYFATMESSARQATFGKQALGLKVTDLYGNRVGFGQATGRFFARILSSFLLIGYLMAAFTPRKQALHDMVASTLVVLG